MAQCKKCHRVTHPPQKLDAQLRQEIAEHLRGFCLSKVERAQLNLAAKVERVDIQARVLNNALTKLVSLLLRCMDILLMLYQEDFEARYNIDRSDPYLPGLPALFRDKHAKLQQQATSAHEKFNKKIDIRDAAQEQFVS